MSDDNPMDDVLAWETLLGYDGDICPCWECACSNFVDDQATDDDDRCADCQAGRHTGRPID